MNKNKELKPCPVCMNNELKQDFHECPDGRMYLKIICENCGTRQEHGKYNPTSEAIIAWNNCSKNDHKFLCKCGYLYNVKLGNTLWGNTDELVCPNCRKKYLEALERERRRILKK